MSKIPNWNLRKPAGEPPAFRQKSMKRKSKKPLAFFKKSSIIRQFLRMEVKMSFENFEQALSSLTQEQQTVVYNLIVSLGKLNSKDDEETPAQKFLKLSWDGDENAEKILENIARDRVNSDRFGENNALFD